MSSRFLVDLDSISWTEDQNDRLESVHPSACIECSQETETNSWPDKVSQRSINSSCRLDDIACRS